MSNLKMAKGIWLATGAGCIPAPDLASAPDQMAAIRDCCRAGAIVVTARGWRAELYVDPIAQVPGYEWSMPIEASLTGRESTLMLHVLCGDAWHVSPHGSTAELLAALVPWIKLAGHRLGSTYRYCAPGGKTATETPGATAALARHRWLAPLLDDLAGIVVGSARDLLDLATRHGYAREALVIRLGLPAPSRLAVIEHVDQVCGSDTNAVLSPLTIEHWLHETVRTGKSIVSEAPACGRFMSELTVVLPTIQNSQNSSIRMSAGAVRFQLKAT